MINIPATEAAEDMPPFALSANFYLATVTSGSGNYWKVKFNGTSSATQKTIKSAYGLTLAVNARVLVIEINGTFLIIARIP